MAELILEGRTLETPLTYGIGYDGDLVYIYCRGSVVAQLSRAQTRTLVTEILQRSAQQRSDHS